MPFPASMWAQFVALSEPRSHSRVAEPLTHSTISSTLLTKQEDIMDDERKCPFTGGHKGTIEPRLVAEPAEPEDPPPEPACGRSHGRGLRLRRGVQDARSRCPEEGHRGGDDDVAGLVAGRLRPLRTALHPDGVAQRGHVPHQRRPRRRGVRRRSASRRSTAGPTTRTSTRRAGCCGRSSRSTAGRSRGPT